MGTWTWFHMVTVSEGRGQGGGTPIVLLRIRKWDECSPPASPLLCPSDHRRASTPGTPPRHDSGSENTSG